MLFKPIKYYFSFSSIFIAFRATNFIKLTIYINIIIIVFIPKKKSWTKKVKIKKLNRKKTKQKGTFLFQYSFLDVHKFE